MRFLIGICEENTKILFGLSRDTRIMASIQVDEMCISILWMIQPDKIKTLFRNPSFTEGGLLPRFLTEHIDCDPTQWRDGDYAPSSQAGWTDIVEKIWRTYRMAETPREIGVTPEAKKLFFAANARLS